MKADLEREARQDGRKPSQVEVNAFHRAQYLSMYLLQVFALYKHDVIYHKQKQASPDQL